MLYVCSSLSIFLLNCVRFRGQPHSWQSFYTESGIPPLWFFLFRDFLPLLPAGLPSPYSCCAISEFDLIPHASKIANKPRGACLKQNTSKMRNSPKGHSLFFLRNHFKSSFYLFLFALQCPHVFSHII